MQVETTIRNYKIDTLKYPNGLARLTIRAYDETTIRNYKFAFSFLIVHEECFSSNIFETTIRNYKLMGSCEEICRSLFWYSLVGNNYKKLQVLAANISNNTC